MNGIEDVLVENERLVYSIINKFNNYGDKDDLYQVGIIGLINAYKNFDQSKNTKFSSYAYFYILGEVKKYIRESLGIKRDRNMEKLSLMVEKATILLTQKLMRYPSDNDIARFLELDEDTIRDIRSSKILIDSLDEESDELSLYDKIGYDEINYRPELLDLRQELANLNPFEKELINDRYYEEKTQKETSEDLGVNQVKISRSEKLILQRLKERL